MLEDSGVALRTRKGDVNLSLRRVSHAGSQVLSRFIAAKRTKLEFFAGHVALGKVTVLGPATDYQLYAVNRPGNPKALKQKLREGVLASVVCLSGGVVNRIDKNEQPRLR